MQIAAKTTTSIAILLLLACSSVLSEELSKLETMENYFSSGAFCSTAEVVKIEAHSIGLVIKLDIEPTTRQALHRMPENQRDDWFSLHCPPEHHPVWAGSKKGFDVAIEEAKSPEANAILKSGSQKGSAQTPQYSLSCSAYIAEQYSQRLSYRERVRLKIEKLLNP